MRRVFVPEVRPGPLLLTGGEAHHVRNVLRLGEGDDLELFDAAGRSAAAKVIATTCEGLEIEVSTSIRQAPAAATVIIASAVPKNERADWLVEKLSELGVSRWIPLQTARSVVHPAGDSKFDRWRRIAVEAAKQSRRAGVMEIAALTPLAALPIEGQPILLSTRPGCVPLRTLETTPRTLLVGPEGGWTEDELASLVARGAVEASLTQTILRIETAAVVAAALSLTTG